MEQFDLPPEEWRWQKDGPADSGGSMLSAAAAQCHIQTHPSSGSRLLYLHATAGVTARARTHAEPKIRNTAVSHSLLSHLEVVDEWNWFLQALCACVRGGVLNINHHNIPVHFPAACHSWCLLDFSDLIVLYVTFNVFRVKLCARSKVLLKHLLIYHTIEGCA